MGNAALRITEFLDQPVKIWMVFSVLALAGLISFLARIFREQKHENKVIDGMIKRKQAAQEDRVKKAIYNPKFMRRKNRDMT